ncbi:hypothetical protein [Chondromyces crocatus]|uniref:Lipoprotein n=1 Tax=Chondromyces crocatus TaxID=52 RepID=A0A0K1EA28_CHOCO|nr:hypothetical protein [Chondromyces crocatus]AKT37537.1 uncharacterized protein CMC5_016780 [Chondromyces crocatus]
MRFRALALGCLIALSMSACAGEEVLTDEVTAEAHGAAAATKITASEGALVLTFDTLGTFQDRPGGRALVIEATANRYLAEVFSFVPDDAFGEANIISPRRLEVVLPVGHELNSILSGLPLLLSVKTNTGSPNAYTAEVKLASRFYDFRGSNSIWIDENVNPIYKVNGPNPLVYRGRADAAASALSVTAPDGSPLVARVDADTFNLDWSYSTLNEAADPHTTPLTFSATLNNGTTVQKTARLATRVVGLALTSGDPYTSFPQTVCTPAAYHCVHGAPDGTTDFSACGTYREVSRCMYSSSACEWAPLEPLALDPIDASALEPARATWNINTNGYTWHHMTSLVAYETPECTDEPKTIQGIIADLEQNDIQHQNYWGGSFLDRAGLANTLFFRSGYPDGTSLLGAVDGFAGGGDIQAWYATERDSCHNCTQNIARAVLFYPGSGLVLVFDGYYGYDS